MYFDSGSRIEPWVDCPKIEIIEMQDPATPVAREGESCGPSRSLPYGTFAVWLGRTALLSHFAHVRMSNVQTLATPKLKWLSLPKLLSLKPLVAVDSICYAKSETSLSEISANFEAVKLLLMANEIRKSIIANLAWRVQGGRLKRHRARLWAAAGEPIR